MRVKNGLSSPPFLPYNPAAPPSENPRTPVPHPARLLLATLLLLTACGKQATQSRVPEAGDDQLLQLNYEGFTVWLDCAQRGPARRGAVRLQYTLTRDQGNHQRHERFYLDPAVPAHGQQTGTDSYQGYADERFDRGHLVPASHADNSANAIRQSNFMTNVLPQASNMNRGALLPIVVLVTAQAIAVLGWCTSEELLIQASLTLRTCCCAP